MDYSLQLNGSPLTFSHSAKVIVAFVCSYGSASLSRMLQQKDKMEKGCVAVVSARNTANRVNG